MINEELNNSDIDLKIENPNENDEKMVKIVNCFLGVVLFSGVMFFLGILFLNWFMAGLGSELEFWGIGLSGTIVLMTAIILMIFNIIIGKRMYNRNKNTNYTENSIKVKRSSYLLKAYFFGMSGSHRFFIGDKKGGIIRLGVTLISVLLIAFFLKPKMLVFSFCVSFLGLGISFGLVISDIVIALSKVSDENKMISI